MKQKIWLFQACLKSWDNLWEKAVCEAGGWERTNFQDPEFKQMQKVS